MAVSTRQSTQHFHGLRYRSDILHWDTYEQVTRANFYVYMAPSRLLALFFPLQFFVIFTLLTAAVANHLSTSPGEGKQRSARQRTPMSITVFSSCHISLLSVLYTISKSCLVTRYIVPHCMPSLFDMRLEVAAVIPVPRILPSPTRSLP